MSKPKAPPAPDYAAAAREQGVANQNAAQQSAYLSNPNIISPYGNQTVSYNTVYDANGKPQMQPTVTQSLTPDAQAALEAQQRVQLGAANLGLQGLKTAQNVMSNPFQYNGPELQTSFGNYGQAGGLSGDYGRANGTLGDYGQPTQNLDLSQLAKMPINAGTTAQQLMMQRLQPQIDQSDSAFRQQMANQGITPGGEAFDNAYRNQSQQTNDLRNQAALAGINLDMAANQQGFNQALQQGQFGNAAQQQRFDQALGAGGFFNAAQGQNFDQAMTAQQLYNQAQGQNYNQALGQAQFGNEASNQMLQRQLGLYNQPLNQINALMSSSQIQTPQFQQYTGQNIEAAPLFNATQQKGAFDMGLYGQKMGQYNAGIQGISSLGAAALSKSDVRLKSNIVKVGDDPRGFGIYDYDIEGRRERGVLAQEVQPIVPEAVATMDDGFLGVKYGVLFDA